jgi:hypothetical protein
MVPGKAAKLKGALMGPPMNGDEKDKMIYELTDKCTQAEKAKEIL